jgi:alpha-methylacyl-CoA racemase
VARGSLVEHEGVIQPAPAPRFSRTEATLGTPPTTAGAATVEALEAWGVKDVIALVESGAAVQA